LIFSGLQKIELVMAPWCSDRWVAKLSGKGAACIFRIEIFPRMEEENSAETMMTDPPTRPAVTQKVNLPTIYGMTRHAVRKNEYRTLIVRESKEHSFGDMRLAVDGRIILFI
jgi:hypothetical protein